MTSTSTKTRRRGNNDKVTELYENIIKATTNKNTASELSIKFARFLRLQLGNDVMAKQVITTAVEADPSNPKLYLQQLDLLINSAPMDIDAITEVFEKALSQDFPEKHKVLFSQRKMEFLSDFGKDIAIIEQAKQEHTKLAAEHKEKEEAAAAAKSKSEEKEKVGSNGSASYAPVNSNSQAYSAQQAQAYNNYGARYNNYQGGPGYGQQWQGQGY